MLLSHDSPIASMATGTSGSPTQYDLPKKIVSLLTNEWNIITFHPPQIESLPIALSGENLLLCSCKQND